MLPQIHTFTRIFRPQPMTTIKSTKSRFFLCCCSCARYALFRAFYSSRGKNVHWQSVSTCQLILEKFSLFIHKEFVLERSFLFSSRSNTEQLRQDNMIVNRNFNCTSFLETLADTFLLNVINERSAKGPYFSDIIPISTQYLLFKSSESKPSKKRANNKKTLGPMFSRTLGRCFTYFFVHCSFFLYS